MASAPPRGRLPKEDQGRQRPHSRGPAGLRPGETADAALLRISQEILDRKATAQRARELAEAQARMQGGASASGGAGADVPMTSATGSAGPFTASLSASGGAGVIAVPFSAPGGAERGLQVRPSSAGFHSVASRGSGTSQGAMTPKSSLAERVVEMRIHTPERDVSPGGFWSSTCTTQKDRTRW